MSKLVEHAERELKLAGLFDADADYDGMVGAAVMELVRVHAAQNHSGGSHAAVMKLFNRVVNFKALSPITSNPDEWVECGSGVWQNRRQSSIFSEDGGKTWHDIDEPKPGKKK